MKIQMKAAAGLLSTASITVAVLLSLAAASDPDPLANGESAASESASTNQVAVLKEIPPSAPTTIPLSPAIEEIVKLAQGGVSDTVLLAYIEKVQQTFGLTADQILYLNDLGLSQDVLTAMLTHDGSDPSLAQRMIDQEPSNTAQSQNPAPAMPLGQAPGAPGYVVNGTPQSQPQPSVAANYIPNGTPQFQNLGGNQQQPIVVQQPPVVVNADPGYDSPAVSYSYFYSSLSPYGSWVLLDGYGWCWQPTIAIAHAGWRPYCHGGRWLDSDCGWYWQSDYSWGWAPFHYGRWFCPPGRSWVWAPDYTWGPSWVTWRSYDDYCGWAPLPPHAVFHEGVGFTYYGSRVGVGFGFGLGYDYFTFVSAGHFSDRHLTSHVIATRDVRPIYAHSTVINNYSRGPGNTYVNIGIGHDRIVNATHHEVPRIAIRDEGPGRFVRPDRIAHEGREPVIYRPKPPSVEAAHQFEVRKSQEIERVSASQRNSPGSRSGSPGTSSFAEARTPVKPFLSPRGIENQENSGSPRATESAREQVASRASAPPLGRPAPLQPESAATVSSTGRGRARQETAPPQSPAASSIANRQAITPQAPGRSTSLPQTQPRTTATVPTVPRPYAQPMQQPSVGTPYQAQHPAIPTTRPVTRQPEPARNATVQTSPNSRIAENEFPGRVTNPRPAPSVPQTPVPAQRQETVAQPAPHPAYNPSPAPAFQPREVTPVAPAPPAQHYAAPVPRVNPAPAPRTAPTPAPAARPAQNAPRAPQSNNRRNDNPH